MAQPIGLLLRGLRIDFPAIVAASKVVLGVGALVVLGAWVGLLPTDVPGWVRVYGGASVALAALHFLTRRFVPPTPIVAGAACPRCSKALHDVGYECPGCGVLSFGHDDVARSLDA